MRRPDSPRADGPAPHDDRALLCLVALAALVVQLPIFDRWLALLDEGYILALADEVNRGKVLYRDVYVDAPFPGAFYLLAAWFRATGPSVWASRLLVVAEFVAFATAIVALGRGLVPRAAAVGLAVLVLCYRVWAFPHWQIYSYSSVAATCVTVAAALVLRSLFRGDRATLAVAGALAGAGILAKQDYGGALGATLTLALLLHALAARRGIAGAVVAPLPFVAGGALVVLPALGALWAAGALDGLVEQAIRAPLRGAMEFGYTRLPALSPLFAQDPALRGESGSYFPSILLTLRWGAITASRLYRETPVWDVGVKLAYYAPLVLFALAALAWLPGALRRPEPARLVVLAWAGGFLLAFNRPRDWVHLMMIYPPALALATALVHGAAARLPRVPAVALRAAAVAALAGLAWWTVGLGWDLRRRFDRPLATPRAGVRTDGVHGPILEDVLAWIDRTAPPGAPVPVWPTQTMIEFLAGREGAGGFHVIWPIQPADRDDRIIADLERRKIDAVVYSLSQYVHIGRFRDNAPRLYEYLVRRWEIDAVFTREEWGPVLTGLRRRPLHPPLGAPVLAHLPERLRLWPFAEVLSVPLGLPDSPPAVSTAMPFPPIHPRFEFRYGVNPERWLDRPHGPFTFDVLVEGERIWTATLDPTARLEDRRWVPATVDLGRWAGRPLAGFAFRVTAPELPPAPDDLVGFENPRIVGE